MDYFYTHQIKKGAIAKNCKMLKIAAAAVFRSIKIFKKGCKKTKSMKNKTVDRQKWRQLQNFLGT